jgi:hypothetical protein
MATVRDDMLLPGRMRALTWRHLLIGLGLLVVLVAAALRSDLDWDENMYLAAGVLSRDHVIYRDFAFLQTPYLPLLYGFVFRVTGTTHFLLAARLVNVVFAWTLVVLAFAIARRAAGDAIGFCVAILIACNEIILLRLSTSCNDVLPMTASLGACLLLTQALADADGAELAPWRTAAAGALLAIATGSKLYYAVTLPAAALVLCVLPTGVPVGRRLVQGVVPLAAGALVALAPILIMLARNWRVMAFDLVGYHLTNSRWRMLYPDPTPIPTRPIRVWRVASLPTNATLILLLVFFGLQLRRRLRTPDSAWLFLSLTVACGLASLVPKPSWEHYFILPIPFAALLVAFLYARLEPEQKTAALRVLVSAAVIAAIFGGMRLLRHMVVWRHLDDSLVADVHDDADHGLRPLVGKGRVATLFPLCPIEAGASIYPQLATAAFTYRVGDMVPDDLSQAARITSPHRIAALLDAETPAGILVGFEPTHELEVPLVRWAEAHHYRRIDHPLNHFKSAVLYVPSEQHAQ